MKPGDPGFRHEWLKQLWRQPDLHGPKKVSVALWGFADEFGQCWPNIQQIAKRIGLRSDSRVSEHLKGLVGAGYVRVGKQPAGNGWISNNYQLVLPTGEGNNSPSSLSVSGPIGPETLGVSVGEIAPTGVGAYLKSGELTPTRPGDVPLPVDDYVVNGRDTRPQPGWSISRADD